MNKRYTLLFLVIANSLVSGLEAQTAGPYTPDQVYSVLYDAIRRPLNITSPYWLSLSVIGSLANADDQAAINDLANFCPPASPTVSSFDREPKLDAIYEHILYGMTGPKREFSTNYFAAKSMIKDTNDNPTVQYTKYEDYEDKEANFFAELITASNSVQRNLANTQLQKNERDWGTFGYKQDLTTAFNIMEGEEYRSGEGTTYRRRTVLSAYQKAGIQANDLVALGGAPFRSPASELSPRPDRWQLADGWVTNSYSSTQTHDEYSRASSEANGFGGLNLGFLTIAGSGGGGNVTESHVHQVYKFNYEFQLKRVSIKRPWLDTSVFFEPKAWTWKKLENTKAFPRVAVNPSTNGMPSDAPQFTYDNNRVGFSLLPVEFIIARGLRVEATVSKSDYSDIEKSGSVSGGGGFFGIFGGGGGKSWTETKTSETDDTVTFLVQSSGTSIIGIISQELPICPDPNMLDNWSDNAWLPQ